jgi:hypothetical protein
MPGMSNYMAQATLNFMSGQASMPALAGRWVALYTTAPTSDAGTGGTEVSGNGYARVQAAGSATTNNTTAAGNATLHFSSTPAWIVAGMTVNDTSASVIPGGTTVLSTTGTTVVMSANATGGGVGNGDTIEFSAWPAASAASGTEPSVIPANAVNAAILTYPTATGSGFGTIVAFGVYDASTSGNLLGFDFIGAYSWLPFSCTSASPGVLTSPAHGYSNGNSVVVTSKFGGTLPTTGGSWGGILTVGGVTTDTFTAGVNTTGTGDGLVRQVATTVVSAGITANFGAASMTLTLA